MFCRRKNENPFFVETKDEKRNFCDEQVGVSLEKKNYEPLVRTGGFYQSV
jgi:hypothetical protein